MAGKFELQHHYPPGIDRFAARHGEMKVARHQIVDRHERAPCAACQTDVRRAEANRIVLDLYIERAERVCRLHQQRHA